MSDATLPRYAPNHEFPPYAFLPGRDPHPTRNPEGHSYVEGAETPPPYFEAEDWRANEEYLFGVDLYNHGYLWEAHEAWEGVWIVSKHDDEQRETLQGLIQCSAAALKLRLEEPRGFGKLSGAGLARLESVCASESMPYMGFDVAAYARDWREFAAGEPTDAEERPRIRLSL